MSAVSKKLRPASMQMSTTLRASAMSSVAPHASKNSSWPPKVPQPKQSSGTLRPERPSWRYSMGIGCHGVCEDSGCARKLISSVQREVTRIQGGKERHTMTVRMFLIGILGCSSIGFSQTLIQGVDPCATAPASCATLIETHATSEMRIPNTAVDVSVGVSASGKDLPEVQRALADQSNKLLGYLQGQQVERLITTRVSFAPDTRDRK